MTTPANLWGDAWGPRLHMNQVLTRRRARRMSRRFADVGIGIPAARLQAIAAGAPVASDELVDVHFALVATEITRQQRLAKLQQMRRRAIRGLLLAGLVLVALNLLLCMACLFISLTLHGSPF
ncbi:hypothetical protein [Mycobacterium botniense]|uniref:Uncharacterized protein n=1 Tax=Mycobacterium botniense TaxID=84962 RepID=A0A7I9Y1A9_9MYCO|nr:hypothetical protein [Mycobacterium botniense]GFG75858.1 hypothetical protein MBOT_32230 [Mycobacterium botniense]